MFSGPADPAGRSIINAHDLLIPVQQLLIVRYDVGRRQRRIWNRSVIALIIAGISFLRPGWLAAREAGLVGCRGRKRLKYRLEPWPGRPEAARRWHAHGNSIPNQRTDSNRGRPGHVPAHSTAPSSSSSTAGGRSPSKSAPPSFACARRSAPGHSASHAGRCGPGSAPHHLPECPTAPGPLRATPSAPSPSLHIGSLRHQPRKGSRVFQAPHPRPFNPQIPLAESGRGAEHPILITRFNVETSQRHPRVGRPGGGATRQR